MKTQIIKLKDGRFIIAYRRHFWNSWSYIEKRFLSKLNAEAYAKRFVWKTKHPRRYRKMLDKLPKSYFTGR